MCCISLRVLFPALSVLVFAGCGDGRPTLVPASGSVTLNGEPLEGAQVGLQPIGIEGYSRPSRATTDASGRFTVGTFDKGDGIPEGSYRVTVIKKELVSKLPEDFNSENPADAGIPIKYKWITPIVYSEPEESGLSVEVTSSGMVPETIALEGEPEFEVMGARDANEP